MSFETSRLKCQEHIRNYVSDVVFWVTVDLEFCVNSEMV